MKLRSGFSAAIAAALLGTSVALPAQADANPAWPLACQSNQTVYPGYWQWVLNFDNSSPTACLVTKSSSGAATFQQSVCKVEGSVTVAGGKATFGPGGYLVCAFDPPGSGMGTYNDFDVLARAEVTQVDGAANANPVFHHNDIRLNLPWVSSTAPVSMSTVWNNVRRTTNNASLSGMHTYHAVLQSGARMHWSDGVLKQQWVNGNVNLNRYATTVFVGFDPVSNKYFGGSIDQILVDPQVRPDCC